MHLQTTDRDWVPSDKRPRRFLSLSTSERTLVAITGARSRWAAPGAVAERRFRSTCAALLGDARQNGKAGQRVVDSIVTFEKISLATSRLNCANWLTSRTPETRRAGSFFFTFLFSFDFLCQSIVCEKLWETDYTGNCVSASFTPAPASFFSSSRHAALVDVEASKVLLMFLTKFSKNL